MPLSRSKTTVRVCFNPKGFLVIVFSEVSLSSRISCAEPIKAAARTRKRVCTIFREQYCFLQGIIFPESRLLLKAFGEETSKINCGSSRRAIDEPEEALRRWRRV